MVERDLAKVEVAGSKPVSRSTFFLKVVECAAYRHSKALDSIFSAHSLRLNGLSPSRERRGHDGIRPWLWSDGHCPSELVQPYGLTPATVTLGHFPAAQAEVYAAAFYDLEHGGWVGECQGVLVGVQADKPGLGVWLDFKPKLLNVRS